MEVITTDDFDRWFVSLDTATDARAVARVVELLEERGVTLGTPHSTAINGSDKVLHGHALRELRVQSGGRPLRVLYAYDPRRDAVLILGGDKTGDDRWYETNVPRAIAIWEQYLAEQAAGQHDGGE